MAPRNDGDPLARYRDPLAKYRSKSKKNIDAIVKKYSMGFGKDGPGISLGAAGAAQGMAANPDIASQVGQLRDAQVASDAIGEKSSPPMEFLQWAGDAIDTLGSGVRASVSTKFTAVEDVLTGNASWDDLRDILAPDLWMATAAKQRLGLDTSGDGERLNQAVTDFENRTGAGEYLQRGIDKNNWQDTPLNNAVVKGAIGFAGDVGLDPLTYATFGTGALGKTAATQATRLAIATAGKEGAEAVATGAAKKALSASDDATSKLADNWVRRTAETTAESGTKSVDEIVEQTLKNATPDELADMAANQLADEAAAAYRRGGNIGLRRTLRDQLGDEAGEALFSAMPAPVRGGIRMFGQPITPRGVGGGRTFDKLGPLGKLGEKTYLGQSALRNLAVSGPLAPVARNIGRLGESVTLAKGEAAQAGTKALRATPGQLIAEQRVAGMGRSALAEQAGRRAVRQTVGELVTKWDQAAKQSGDEKALWRLAGDYYSQADDDFANIVPKTEFEVKAKELAQDITNTLDNIYANNKELFPEDFFENVGYIRGARRVEAEGETARRAQRTSVAGNRSGSAGTGARKKFGVYDDDGNFQRWLSVKEVNEGLGREKFSTDLRRVVAKVGQTLEREAGAAALGKALRETGLAFRLPEDLPLSNNKLLGVGRDAVNARTRQAERVTKAAADMEANPLTALQDPDKVAARSKAAKTANKAQQAADDAARRADELAAAAVAQAANEGPEAAADALIRADGARLIAQNLQEKASAARAAIDAINDDLGRVAKTQADKLRTDAANILADADALRAIVTQAARNPDAYGNELYRALADNVLTMKRATVAEVAARAERQMIEASKAATALDRLLRSEVADEDMRAALVGQRVKVTDRGNYGNIVKVEGNDVTVRFYNRKTGARAERIIPVDQLQPTVIEAAQRRAGRAEMLADNVSRLDQLTDPSKSVAERITAPGSGYSRLGTVEIKGEVADISKALQDYFTDDVTARALTRMYEVKTTSQARTFMTTVYDPLEALWRTYATVGRGPGYVARNVLGGMWNAFIPGANAKDFKIAFAHAKAVRRGTQKATKAFESGAVDVADIGAIVDTFILDELAATGIKVNGRGLDEWHSEAVSRGMFVDSVSMALSVGGNISPDQFVRGTRRNFMPNANMEGVGKAGQTYEKVIDVAGNNFWIRYMSEFAGGSEMYLRMGTFYSGVRQYGEFGADMGELLVKATQFDYGDLSAIERRIVRFGIPFFVWTKNNVPLQLRTLINQPGKVSGLLRLNASVQQMVAGDGENSWADPYLPEWMREYMGKVSGIAPTGSPWVFGLNAPLTDLNRFLTVPDEPLNPLSWGEQYMSKAGDDVKGSMNPFAKAAIESVSGTNSFTGAKFTDREAPGWYQMLAKLPLVPDTTIDPATGKVMANDFVPTQLRNLLPPLGQAERLAPVGPLYNERYRDRWLTSVLSQTVGPLSPVTPVGTLTDDQLISSLKRNDREVTDNFKQAAAEKGLDGNAILRAVRNGATADDIRSGIESGFYRASWSG
jgi:hypothetical protein